MKNYTTILGSVLLGLFSVVSYAQAPVPFVRQPLVPAAATPGGPAFALTVNGTGFTPDSTIRWNASVLVTQFVNNSELRATVPASDIAQAGTASVTVATPGPGGGTSGTVFFPITTPTSSVTLARNDFAAAGGNIQVVTADFDGDGKLDLATAEYYSDLVRIFLGNGDGTFRTGPTYAGCNPHALATGDFNGDGVVDVAVGARGCRQITILLGIGDGTFKESGDFATGTGGPWGAPYTLLVGDFNADGKLDFATANENDTASVLLGNGDGTFQSHVEYATVSDSRSVATGDFNGDGRLDLAVSSGSNSAVSVLLGNGDGTFQPQSQYIVNGTMNIYVIAADLNQDGILDLVVANTSGWVSILLGKGDGTFHSGGKYATGGVSAALTVADFSGDGILDLATPNYYSSSLSLLLGKGDGTFKAHTDYPGSSGARGVAVGDFNGDGRLDLAVGNQFVDTISVYLQTVSDAVTVSPSSLSFGSQLLHTTSSSKKVTLSNTTGAAIDISGIAASANFLQKNNCGSRLAAGASCTITVSFRPMSICAKTGTLTITDNASHSPQTVALSGVGTVVTLSTTHLNFGNQAEGTTSPTQTITLTNHATSRVVPIFNVLIKGGNFLSFAQTNTCGTGVAAGASCTFSVTFTPLAPRGKKASTLYIWNGGGNTPEKVTLNGNGT